MIIYRWYRSQPQPSTAADRSSQSAAPPQWCCAELGVVGIRWVVGTGWKACIWGFSGSWKPDPPMDLWLWRKEVEALRDVRETVQYHQRRMKHSVFFSLCGRYLVSWQTASLTGWPVWDGEGEDGLGSSAVVTFVGLVVANSKTNCSMSARGYLVEPEP